jgi:ketosteroid isomerase-like protein
VTASLEARVATLEAESAVRRAMARYGRAIDARDLAGVGAVFADDVVLENAAGRFEGSDRALAHIGAVVSSGGFATHLVGAIEVTTHDVSAPTAAAAFLFVSASRSASRSAPESGLRVGAGRYDAAFAASGDGEMRFTHLRIDIGYSATLATEGDRT